MTRDRRDPVGVGFTTTYISGVATLGSNRHVSIHKFDKFKKNQCSIDALYVS